MARTTNRSGHFCMLAGYLSIGALIFNLLKEATMFIVHVFVHVKPDQIETFAAASLE